MFRKRSCSVQDPLLVTATVAGHPWTVTLERPMRPSLFVTAVFAIACAGASPTDPTEDPGPVHWTLAAFPGAEGFGAGADGGRGGAVLHVTTLSAVGPGLRTKYTSASNTSG